MKNCISIFLLSSSLHSTPVSAGHSKGKGSKTSVPSTTPSLTPSEPWKCEDDEDYIFNTEFAGDADCEWLSEKRERQEKYCETKGWDNAEDGKVKYACRASCALYLDNFEDECEDEIADKVSIVESNEENEEYCEDEDDFVFSTEFWGEQDCAWLSDKVDRQDKYCETLGWNSDALKKVKYGCKASCVDHLENYECEAPTKWCVDEEDFLFETEFVAEKDCEWLAEKVSRQQKYCETRGYDDSLTKKIKYGCKVACAEYNRCGSDTPSVAPTQTESDHPSYSPSIAPSDDWCYDEEDFTFNTEFAGEVDCGWLAMWTKRQELYCESRGYGDNASNKLIKFGCRETCSAYNRCSS